MSQFTTVPDAAGRFGPYGGRYVPETLVAALDQLAEAYEEAQRDQAFQDELDRLLREFAGRPTPLTVAARLSEHLGGPPILLKREDLAHTGSHKINNAIGQALLALRMGKKRIIAETGAGQHGVATATACAHFGLECEVYMGAEDVRRQSLNVFRMQLLGAKVNVVQTGSRTLKDATNEAMRNWMESVEYTHYILGSVVGPHPYPMIVRDFQSVIGRELREQLRSHPSRDDPSCDRPRAVSIPPFAQERGQEVGRASTGAQRNSLDKIAVPGAIIACVGGGSNGAGIFYPFINDRNVRLIGVEAGGRSANVGEHAAPLSLGAPGVLHGSLSYVLQDAFGQTSPVHSCSAGLDYPGVGPEHSYWKDAGRVEYMAVSDDEALEAFGLLARLEGIIPALETAHAVAGAMCIAREMDHDQSMVINISGRGDKDVQEAMRLLEQRND